MPSQSPTPSPESRLDNLLRSLSEGGSVHVVVGYASVWGLAWLARRTKGCAEVTISVGDLAKSRFKKGTLEDRHTAIEFLERPEVHICNWYSKTDGSTGKKSKDVRRKIHTKVYLAESNEGIVNALVGSANLTKQGLTSHTDGGDIDLLVTPVQSELKQVRWHIEWIEKDLTFSNKADSKARLLKVLWDEMPSDSLKKQKLSKGVDRSLPSPPSTRKPVPAYKSTVERRDRPSKNTFIRKLLDRIDPPK